MKPSVQRIDKKLVHKHNDLNVLLARVERGEHGDSFRAEMYIDRSHPFFFEHPVDHVPALMIVESGRQLGIAVCHMFYDVPFGTVFVTNEFSCRFLQFAQSNHPVMIESTVSDKEYKNGRLVRMHMEGDFIQHNAPIGWMGGNWTMLSKDVYGRLRSAGPSQHRSDG